jgi:hypothetical protein
LTAIARIGSNPPLMQEAGAQPTELVFYEKFDSADVF